MKFQGRLVAIFVDSSVWIEWLRTRTDPRPLLRPWLLRRQCYTCGIVRAEVVRGVLNRAQRERVEALFDVLEEVAVTSAIWKEAARECWEIDRRGKILPLTDIVIAECVKKCGAWLVTLDKHFKEIPGIRTRTTLPRAES